MTQPYQLVFIAFALILSSAQVHAASRFVVMPAKKDQVVVDGKVEWQRVLTDGKGVKDLAAATKHCSKLKLQGKGWRVPTLDELMSLVEKEIVPTIDKGAFPDTPLRHFMTSSMGEGGKPWLVNFHYGNKSPETLDLLRVRCVRDVKPK